jgi:peptidoglycan-associated lipoprotein
MNPYLVIRSSVAAFALVSGLLDVGCASTPPANEVASVPPPPPPPPAARAGQAARPPQSRPVALLGTIAISNDIRSACGITDKDAHFAYDSSKIQEEDVASLDAVAACFTSGALQGRAMRLVGHADPRGPDEYNMVLGQNRADSVQRYLSQRGLEPGQVATTSRGAMDAKGEDEGGWAHDRRVDVMLSSDRIPATLGVTLRQPSDPAF